ncbi:8291_t:CDS:2 [Acaulospora morrowiae]|uniref:8291_t:CDS:1 n=1 Tax=Acaulospora morrowiae TaxID=94023 RepID=A0A9N9C8S7_9GLOM|nr:8291_t:CDS:2 [Acaulospora morrowiae]
MTAIEPKTDCPHIKSDILDNWRREIVDVSKPCLTCHDVSENWRCLECNIVLCSSYVNGHMREHNQQTGHPLVVSFSDLSFWCYSCDEYVISPILHPIKVSIYVAKFGELPPDYHDASITNGEDMGGEGSSANPS